LRFSFAVFAGVGFCQWALTAFKNRMRLSLNRPLRSYGKIQRAVSSIIRNKRWAANIKQSGVYLNVGSGPQTHPDFCNIDYTWFEGVDICWDITRPLPIPSEYVGGVFTEHCLEHIRIQDGLQILREFFRVMRTGAYIRIVVPDAEIYLTQYAKRARGESFNFPYGTDTPYARLPGLEGMYTPVMSVNRIFLHEYENQGHRFIYDFETMNKLLERAGFSDVRKLSFGVGNDSKLLIDTASREVESLYVEARVMR
jgi:predicted SAM-dependent methyltransferase